MTVQALGQVGSIIAAHRLESTAQGLWYMGLTAPQHVGSSQTRKRTHVPGIGSQILSHWATREALHFLFNFKLLKFAPPDPVSIFPFPPSSVSKRLVHIEHRQALLSFGYHFTFGQ